MEKRAAMDENWSEERLIEACRQGDRDAFRQLFETHKDRVWSIALNFVGDEAVARDVTQQVFLKLFTAIGQFRQEAAFSTWLYRLVVNVCMDEQRRSRRFLSFDFFKSGDDGTEKMNEMDRLQARQLEQGLKQMAQEDHHARFEISTAVKAAVKELKPRLRMAILLKYFEGLSYEEMARVLNCSPGTVASRLNRGHKELARKLAHLRAPVEPEK